MQSMTAFARVQSQQDQGHLCWEIKSVNHRYCETSFRMPEGLRFLEVPLRQKLNQFCSRGKFDCQLKVSTMELGGATLRLNHHLAASLLKEAQNLAQNLGLQNAIDVSFLLAWPGVTELGGLEMEVFAQPVMELFESALKELVAMRIQEGHSLRAFLHDRLHQIQQELHKARVCAEEAMRTIRITFAKRLEALKLSVDPVRMEQEVAILLTKLDVSEEIERLEAHLLEVARITDNNECIGRRLDFLMQELNREANTLSSKSDSIALTQCAVEMKVLIEQMREQVQNVE